MAPKVPTRFDGKPAKYFRNWTLVPKYSRDLVEEYDMNILKGDFTFGYDSPGGGVGGVFGVVATHDAARKIVITVLTWEAENESKATWDRFLGATSDAVTGFDKKKSIVITDGSKGAAAAVEERDTQHMLDSVHVSDNIKDKFKGEEDEYRSLYLSAFHAKNAPELHAAKAKYPPS